MGKQWITYREGGVVLTRSIKSVTNSEVNGGLEEIMLQDDEAIVHRAIRMLAMSHYEAIALTQYR